MVFIKSVEVISTHDDAEYFDRSFTSITSDVIYYQSPQVDAVSGATYSSNGIMDAIADALKSAKVNSQTETNTETTLETTTNIIENTTANTNTAQTTTRNTANTTVAQTTTLAITQTTTAPVSTSLYRDGTFSGSGNGFRGTITLNVTISGGKITDIAVISFADDAPYFNNAFSSLRPSIISAQSTAVNGVSGATFSSKGIKAAVSSALSKATQ